MAGDWIPIGAELPRRREVLVIAAATKMHRREVVGTLIEFWLWAQAESPDGEITGVLIDQLPSIIDGTKVSFWQAVEAAGWLVSTPTGILIPGAQHWITSGAKARLLDAKRKRDERYGPSGSNGTDPGGGQDIPPGRSGQMSGSAPDKTPPRTGQKSRQKPDTNRTTEQNRREEKNIQRRTVPGSGSTERGTALESEPEDLEEARRTVEIEHLITDIQKLTKEWGKTGVYRAIVLRLPRQDILEAVSELKESLASTSSPAQSPGALFMTHCKRKAALRGVVLFPERATA